MFRTSVRPPISASAFSTTTTTLATLTVVAPSDACICITGYSIVWGTAPNTTVGPLLTFSGVTPAIQLANGTDNVTRTFASPIKGPTGKNAAISATVTAAAAISLSLMYYYAN